MTADAGQVGDEEHLYRSVPDGCYTNHDGKMTLSQAAFNDRARRPSVDRAKLCGFDPTFTQKHGADGVVFLVTADVRQIVVSHNDQAGHPLYHHRTDVQADPIESTPGLQDNPAHALIVSTPAVANDKVFRRLKEKLALLGTQGGWLIAPSQTLR